MDRRIIVAVVGGVASGKSTLIAQLNIALPQGHRIELMEGGPLSGLPRELMELPGAPIPEMALRMSSIERLSRDVSDQKYDIVLHLITSPAKQGMILRKRRDPGDELWRVRGLRTLDAYERAVYPQLCDKHGIFYFPVQYDRGVSLADFLPELLRVAQSLR